MKQYAITMAIRTICVILAFAIQPWGWHTAVLSVGAIFLPYFAVVLANQVGSTRAAPAERPEIAIEGPAREQEQRRDDVIRIEESRSDDGRTP